MSSCPGLGLIEGTVDRRFEPLREAFSANFSPSDDDPGDLGAALAVIVDGRVVVDLWGGWCDPDRSRRWERDTLVNLYSIGKAVTATVALALVERGELELDRPLVQVWPEFGTRARPTSRSDRSWRIAPASPLCAISWPKTRSSTGAP